MPDKRDGEKEKEEKMIAHFLGSAIDDLACVRRLIKEYGWYTSDFFYGWLKDTIKGQFDKKKELSDSIINKKGLQTFADFKEAGFRDIYISVTNITKRRNEIFSFETKPHMPVVDAVRMSMSIPLYFNSIEYEGDRYADGGTVNNYPMEVFDDQSYVSDLKYFREEVNYETIGCHLFSPEKSQPHHQPKDNLIHYIEDLFMTLLEVQEIEFNKTPNLQERSANISNLNISPVDFNIQADKNDPLVNPNPDSKYDQLYVSGYKGMQKYLEEYRM